MSTYPNSCGGLSGSQKATPDQCKAPKKKVMARARQDVERKKPQSGCPDRRPRSMRTSRPKNRKTQRPEHPKTKNPPLPKRRHNPFFCQKTVGGLRPPTFFGKRTDHNDLWRPYGASPWTFSEVDDRQKRRHKLTNVAQGVNPVEGTTKRKNIVGTSANGIKNRS